MPNATVPCVILGVAKAVALVGYALAKMVVACFWISLMFPHGVTNTVFHTFCWGWYRSEDHRHEGDDHQPEHPDDVSHVCIFAVGQFSMGIFAFGQFPLGLIASFGMFTFAGMFGLGLFAVSTGVAVGMVAVGSCAVTTFGGGYCGYSCNTECECDTNDDLPTAFPFNRTIATTWRKLRAARFERLAATELDGIDQATNGAAQLFGPAISR
eukprot:SAG31_NODE_2150_length_6327_cov_4.325947_2_plen_211_part_00